MDYEKAYKESFEAAKGLHDAGDALTKKQMEIVFPELAESEDERIRTRLSEYFRGFLEGNEHCYEDGGYVRWEGLDVKSILAWLEKQKDASKAIEAVERIDRYIDEHLANAHEMKDSNPDKKYYRGWDDALGKMAWILQDVYSDEKQKEQNPEVKDPFDDEQFRRGYEAGKNDAEKEINTQLLHWREKVNEKMERETFPDYDIKVIADDIVSGLKASGDVYENIHNAMEQKPATWHGDDGLKPAELTPLTDLLSNYLKNDFEYFATAKWDEKKWNEVMNIQASELLRVAQNELKKEQKSAEWSEEDEYMAYFVNQFLEYHELSDPTAKSCKKWFNNRFKSLRNRVGKEFLQPHWKPSEDEERLIKTSISFLKDFADKGYENAVECIDWLKSKLNGDACK